MSPRRAQLLSVVGLCSLPVLAFAGVHVPTDEIAPGVDMPRLSIGTGGLESEAARAIVTNWLGQGGRGIDTALMYKNQDVVREAVQASGIPREQLFITTKIPGCANAAANIEEDFKLLGMDYIDLMLIHFPTPGMSCVPAWKALEDYHSQGKIRAIGVSNFKTAQLQEIMGSAKVKPVVNQVQYNILRIDDDTVDFCDKSGIRVEAYSPLGRANHSGDITGNKVVKGIASNHNVSTFQIALRFIMQHGHLVTFQSTSQKHQAQDADIFGFNLTASEMSQLDGLHNKATQNVIVV